MIKQQISVSASSRMEGQLEEEKFDWTPYSYTKTWKEFKQFMAQKGFKQKIQYGTLEYNYIEYACKLNNSCSSMYKVENYTDYFVVEFNNVEHSMICRESLNEEEKISEMLKAGAKPSKIAETLNLNGSKKEVKRIYNQKQAIKDKAEKKEFIYDISGIEKWALERHISVEELQSLGPHMVFVPEYDLGQDYYYVIFLTKHLIMHLEEYVSNLGYIGLMVDGTYRLDHSDSVLFVLAVLAPNRKTQTLAYCIGKSENSIILSRFILKVLEIFRKQSSTKPSHVFIMGDLASFIDKAIDEIIVPELNKDDIIVRRLICAVHFQRVIQKMNVKANLGLSKTAKKDEVDGVKKTIYAYVKLLTYAQKETIFSLIWKIFSEFIEKDHPEFYKKFKVYGTKKLGYSLFKRPILIPFDNNPLEGVNNMIKIKITEYVRQNMGVLLKDLESEIKDQSEKLEQGRRIIWERKLRIPHLLWKYGLCLSNILKEVSVQINEGNQQRTLFIGEKYAFQTYLDARDKNKAASEIRVKDKAIRIEADASDKDIQDFFKSDVFFKPTSIDMNIYNNPSLEAKTLQDCFLLVSIKETIVRNTMDDSECTCSDFTKLGYCLHIISGLLYFKKVSPPPALALSNIVI